MLDEEGAKKAKFYIESIIADVEVGKPIWVPLRIMDFGALSRLSQSAGHGGKEGLVHISQLAEERVNKVRDVVDIGDQILVKVTEIDKQGRINLSRKAVLANAVKHK